MIRLVLGLLGGAAVGAALGLLLSPDNRAGGSGHGAPRLGGAAGLLDRARRTFEVSRERARSAAQEAAHATGDAAQSGAVQLQETAGTAVTTVTAPVQGFAGTLKARWREAVAEGKQASAEKQEELRRRYLEDTKRV